MNRIQKITSLWLTVSLMLALVPIQVLAQEENVPDLTTETAADAARQNTVIEAVVAEDAANVAAAAKNESWIQEQINNGLTEIYIDDAIVLENDYAINNHVRLILRNGSITVPSGKTLTNYTAQINVWENSSITVENGGSFVNRSEIIVSGTFAVYGSFEGIVHTYHLADRTNATIIGVPDSDIWMHYVVEGGTAEANQAQFLENWALMESTNYGRYSQQIHGDMTLPDDLVIPSNCYFVLEVNSFTFTIPAGVTVTNLGEFYVYANQTVANYGTFENAGYLNIQGNWIGNQPVTAQMTQDQLEQAMAQADHYNLNQEVILERDMTISKWFGIQPGARMVVPEGVKLTVAANIAVMAGGRLDIQGDYELIPVENAHRSIGLYLENGVYSTINGVADKDLSLNCKVYNTEQLMNAINVANNTNYGWDFAYVYQNASFANDVMVDCFIQVTNGAAITVEKDVSVTNDHRMEFWEGTSLINEGHINNNNELLIFGGANLNNKGTIQVEGVLAVYGSAVNSGTVSCGSNAHLDITGTWEGNQPVAPHTHNYTEIVTNPSCTEGGYTTYTCSTCGQSYIGNYIYATGLHIFANDQDTTCDTCGYVRALREVRPVVHMFRMYDPNSGEHFYTGSEEERENLIKAGWNYEGVGFTFPLTTGDPVYRLYDPVTGEHLYTMDPEEKVRLEAAGWNYEGIAFNSGFADEVPQHRLHNPNETRGAYHFTSSLEERENLLAAGWEYEGIGWYSCWK